MRELDIVAKKELTLYLENTYKLHRQKQDIIKNLLRKIKKEKYDPDLAWKLWLYWVTAGAKEYIKEHCRKTDTIRSVFPKVLRETIAKELAEEYKQRMDNKEFE